MLITRSSEPCGRAHKWSLNDCKIQVLLCAFLKCICISPELQQENCSCLHKHFHEFWKPNLYLYVHNYHNGNNCRWFVNSKSLPSWDFFIPNFCYHNLLINILCKQIPFIDILRAKRKIRWSIYSHNIFVYLSNRKIAVCSGIENFILVN